MGTGPTGLEFGENSLYRETWDTRRLGSTRRIVDCRRVLWVPGPRGQYSGKIRFIKKLSVQDEGVATCLNVVLTQQRYARESKANFMDGAVWGL